MTACKATGASTTPPTVEPGVNTRCVAVAFSGGLDSTALLHATASQAAENGMTVVALHVNHGLSAHADEWQRQCEALCEAWAARGWTASSRETRTVVVS